MPLEYTVKDAQGNELPITTDQLASDLKNMGVNVLEVDPSGMSFKIQTKGGQVFDAKTDDILAKHGYAMSHATPIDPDYSEVSPWLRAAVSQVGDPAIRQAYLENVVRRHTGEANPKIMGKDDDWFYYGPNGWKALTNKPGMDISDLAQYGPKAGKFAASVGGAILGGGAGMFGGGGVGAVPGAMVGAGAGSALANSAIEGVLQAGDPDYREVIGLGGSAKNIAKEAGTEALATGVFGGIGAVGGPVVRKAMQTGVASTIGKGVSDIASGLGNTASAVAGRIASSPIGRDVAAMFNPVTGTANSVGYALRLPGEAIKAIPQAAKYLGKNQTSRELLGEETAQKIGEWGAKVGAQKTPNFMSRVVGSEEASAADVMNRAAQSAKNFPRATETFSEPTIGQTLSQGAREAYPEALRTTGQIASGMESLGRGLTGLSEGASTAMLRGAQGVGSAVGAAGKVGSKAFGMTKPFENYSLYREGLLPYAEERLSPTQYQFPREQRMDIVGDPLKNFYMAKNFSR